MAARGQGAEPVQFEAVRQIQQRVAQQLTAQMSDRQADGRPLLGAEDKRHLARSLTIAAINAHASGLAAKNQEVPTWVEDGRLAAAVDASMFGTGPLQPILADPDLENLDLNGYDHVWATYASRGRVRLPAFVDSDVELIEVFRALAAHAGTMARPWSSVHPQLDLGLPGGVRVSGLLAASARPQISIRRDRLGPQAFLDEAPRRFVDAISLVGLGTMDRQCALFLTAAVRARANILVAGAVNTGKTTLLRAMANAIPAYERLVTIEQALELRLGRDSSLHEDVVELETVLPSAEGNGGLDGADLVRRSKRMNPDRLIYGEVLHGPEARAMLEAMLQGGDGSMSTIHSRDAYGAISRMIIGLGALSEPVQPATAAALIGQAVDFVVYVRKTSGGRRVISEILEVSGHQGETVSCATIFGLFNEGDESATARRDTRISLRRADLLARHGYTDEAGKQLNAEPPRSRNRSRYASGEADPRSGQGRRSPGYGSSGRVPDSRRTAAGESHYATLSVDEPPGLGDPVAIPVMDLEPVVEQDSGRVAHQKLELPDDGRDGPTHLAHRYQSEPLTPAHLPVVDEEPFATGSSPRRDPIIDMAARRSRHSLSSSPEPATSSAVRGSWSVGDPFENTDTSSTRAGEQAPVRSAPGDEATVDEPAWKQIRPRRVSQ